MSGVDADSVFDLPYAVDDTPLPPPPAMPPAPDPSLPPPPDAWTAPIDGSGSGEDLRDDSATVPTSSAATATAEPAPSPSRGAGDTSTPAQSPAPLPAPLDAGRLAGSSFDDDYQGSPPLSPTDGGDDRTGADGTSPLHGSPSPDGSPPGPGTEQSGSATAMPSPDPTAPEVTPPPAAPATMTDASSPSLVRRLSRSGHRASKSGLPADTAAPSPGPGSGPAAPALPFSPGGPPAQPATHVWPDTGAPAPYPSSGPPTFATIQPFAPSPDPRQARGAPVVVTDTRIGDGLLVAGAAAAVAGVIWWATVALTQRQFPYIAVLLGVLVGQAALVGGRKGSIGLGVTAAAVTLLSLSATQYFITRSLAISELGVDLPLWDGSSTYFEVTRTAFGDDPLNGVFVVIAAVIAGLVAGTPGQRAAGSLGTVRVTRAPERIL